MTRPLRLAAFLLALVAAPRAAAAQPAVAGRLVALTFDDLPFVSPAPYDTAYRRVMTDSLLRALKRARVTVTGFVNETQLHPAPDAPAAPSGVALLRAWLDAGHDLGNHTWSHVDLHAVSPAAYLDEVARGEVVTRALLAERGRAPRWFRHPFLHTGRSLEARHAVEEGLRARGYRVAPVTLDGQDHLFARAYDRARAGGDAALAGRVRAAYLTYMDSVTGYYVAQSRAFLGREMPHVLLLHASALNAASAEALVDALRRRGFGIVPLERVVADSAYASADTYVGPGGISWLHRWALTAGRRGAFFAGEPEVPAWVMEMTAR